MPILLQVVLRSLTQFVLFVVGDTFESASVAVILAEADLDEYEDVAFGHDDIDLTMTATIIPCYRF